VGTARIYEELRGKNQIDNKYEKALNQLNYRSIISCWV